MNIYHIVGAIIVTAFIVLGWYLYRVYKRFGRRCAIKGCGCMTTRRSKILLAPDEMVSCRSPEGKRRWWIRRVIKLTFTICEKHGAKLVKIDTDPISLWHALWVKWFHKEQYYLADQDLAEAARQKFRALYLGSRCERLDPGATDTPPISLDALLKGCFDEINMIIGDDED